jgi:hypothetical protein
VLNNLLHSRCGAAVAFTRHPGTDALSDDKLDVIGAWLGASTLTPEQEQSGLTFKREFIEYRLPATWIL